jgi:hypothetical protein
MELIIGHLKKSKKLEEVPVPKADCFDDVAT